MIVRYEPFGAWVKLESVPAIVSLDRDGVRALGLDGGNAWQDNAKEGGPLEVHLSVTTRCGAGCTGCYVDAKPDGYQPDFADLVFRLEAMKQSGVFTVAFGGGEPLVRNDLHRLANEAKARGLTPVLTTSGRGLTHAKVEQLRSFAQVNVSYDGVEADYEEVRGYDGARSAERAITMLANAAIRVGANIVLTRQTFGSLGRTISRVRDLGAVEAQLLRYKPAGRAATLDYLAKRLGRQQVRAFEATLRDLCERFATDTFRIRIDCALVPFLSVGELAKRPERFRALGVFGCEAAGNLAAIAASGSIAPCSFAEATPVQSDALSSLREQAPLEAWHTRFGEPCASCELQDTCKGGCKVVSQFLTKNFEADPECPRVLAFHASRLGERKAHLDQEPADA